MRILFYLLALIAGTFGLLALVRATEAALSGGGLNGVQFVTGIMASSSLHCGSNELGQ